MDLGGRSSGSVSLPRRTSADGNQRAIVANSVSNVPAGCGAGAIGPTQAIAQAPDVSCLTWPHCPAVS